MTDRRPEGPVHEGASPSPPPVPADLPDQQVQDGEDPMDVPTPPRAGRDEDDGRDLPDPDESGSGRGEARNAGVHPEHPVPDESPG
ncbi:hypothetical protein ACIOEZ_31655 [Streptomyces sp. NPDC087866]|uniref:hypothetical protein n=1 Tax=unclassified Streptomyces TaxID=2593676 RepID=UPI002257E13F|nr:hypothetical protein [Streptomyces sp. NBC_01789]MCX4450834.1 hypothetical protein [Streptomyces sp. NBC_01789]